ncbi:DUF3047 domain-containing protein [Dasania sp. GY-MA-18]|uniref:DUF3047 domain-containing protein n=1 Tax=Dasania phycosphaerae TaxID=2950436 RepID=A0A9J6RNK9_9GAMM|nr:MULTISPECIES: DUF3047 domain-containing protein [Dasania]MCR8923650.1 DUF3047 domain-containing protein [Dasania sp. GY-MA-18]MCZ0866084.1 DUF3047 domain-containing protein [Dasania phycosphaerae]MCZ0869808.1 DUF3047 domain-containing protein [Dasania phycosphaerae]
MANFRARIWRIVSLLRNFLLLIGAVGIAAEPLPAGWQQRSFVGHTQYRLEQQQGREVILAHSQGTASMLYKEQSIDLRSTPVVRWRWKVAAVYGRFNEREKSGDDYPARFYVVCKTGPLPWQTLALNYVWSSNGLVGERWPNAYTSKAMMIVLRAGAAQVGQWQWEQRNLRADFKQAFGVDVNHLDGYAIMVDGDNTGSTGTAWFGDISFSAN